MAALDWLDADEFDRVLSGTRTDFRPSDRASKHACGRANDLRFAAAK